MPSSAQPTTPPAIAAAVSSQLAPASVATGVEFSVKTTKLGNDDVIESAADGALMVEAVAVNENAVAAAVPESIERVVVVVVVELEVVVVKLEVAATVVVVKLEVVVLKLEVAATAVVVKLEVPFNGRAATH